MKPITIIFLLLRKNAKMLGEFVNDINAPDVRIRRRKQIIDLKSKLAALKPAQYMLVKTIATELHRFDILEPFRKFYADTGKVTFVVNDKVLKTVSNTARYGRSESEPDPSIIYDKVHGLYFVLSNDDTMVDDIVLFEGAEHEWFKEVFLGLRDAKDAEEKIMADQKIHEEKMRLLNRKENILSKYN